MTLQGHPRLLILVPIESACVTCYWSAIVTLVLTVKLSSKYSNLGLCDDDSVLQHHEQTERRTDRRTTYCSKRQTIDQAVVGSIPGRGVSRAPRQLSLPSLRGR